MKGLLIAGILAAAAFTPARNINDYYGRPRSSGPKNGKTARRAKQKLARAAKQNARKS